MTPLIRWREFATIAAEEAGLTVAEFTAALADRLERSLAPGGELVTPEALCAGEFAVAPLTIRWRADDVIRAAQGRALAAAV